MALTISPKLTLIFVVAAPILGIALVTISKKAHPMFQKVFNTYDKLNNVVQENLRGIRVVKSFVREDYEREKFDGISQSIFTDFTKVEKLLALNQPIMQTIIYTCMLLISWFGAKMIVNSGGTELTTGLLTSLFSYAMQILSSLMMLGMFYVMITMSRTAAERICEVLDEESSITEKSSPVKDVKDGSVKFDHVDFSYKGDPNKLCMSDISFEIKSGEIVGIIGGTGSSKSTLVQLIPRLYDTTNGSVYVGGINVRDYDMTVLRDAVAMVLQKNELFSGTIKENLRWGNEHATDEEIIEACKLAQADGFIQEMPNKYDTYIEQGGTNVSGGQKQRLCIARALLKKPKILILDDSTSAVDTKTDALIRMGFRSFIPDTTKIIIAQRISSVQDADKIIVLDDGRISAIGTHDELLEKSEIYREVYTSQTKGDKIDG
jgi:ATP-binding cassette subfamily B protein